MSAAEREGRPQAHAAGAGLVSMRELLASCAAARAVSTPPWTPAPSPTAPGRAEPAAPADAVPRDGDGPHGAAA